MTMLMRHVMQVLLFLLFAVAIGYFSASPAYQYAPNDMAVIKLSLSHPTERVAPCVLLTPEQVAALAPNMRRSESCERKRLPLLIELDVDGELVLSRQALPSGLWSDGLASIYEKLALPAGRYKVNVRLRDSARETGWDYTYSDDVELVAGHYLTISFKAENGGFKVR